MKKEKVIHKIFCFGGEAGTFGGPCPPRPILDKYSVSIYISSKRNTIHESESCWLWSHRVMVSVGSYLQGRLFRLTHKLEVSAH